MNHDSNTACEHGIALDEFCEPCQRRIFYARRQERRDPGYTGGLWADLKAAHAERGGRPFSAEEIAPMPANPKNFY